MEQNEQLLTTDPTTLDQVPLERLESEISGFASRLAAATARWLIWIAAYDRREGWRTWETKSCAHWLNWHCGVAPRTAREHVQIAHKLEAFPLLRETFAAGELSYSKVRALVRVVEPVNEADLIDLARRSTASQLERIVGKMPEPDVSADESEATESNGGESNGDDIRFTYHGDGTMTMQVTRPVAEMANVRTVIESKTTALIANEQNDGETRSDVIERMGGIGPITADVATGLITGTIDAPRGTESTVLVVADIDALRGVDGRAESTVDSQRVDPAVVRRLCCDGIIQAALVDGNGLEQATGSEQRIVPRRIRRMLERRDHGMCQHPGCESTNRIHAHHVIHWANGGPTQLENLILLCHYHHHSVHEGGWNIAGQPGGWQFIDPNGNPHSVPVLRLPTTQPLPSSNARPVAGTAAPLAGSGERADLNFIADVVVSNTELPRSGLSNTELPRSGLSSTELRKEGLALTGRGFD